MDARLCVPEHPESQSLFPHPISSHGDLYSRVPRPFTMAWPRSFPAAGIMVLAFSYLTTQFQTLRRQPFAFAHVPRECVTIALLLLRQLPDISSPSRHASPGLGIGHRSFDGLSLHAAASLPPAYHDASSPSIRRLDGLTALNTRFP